MAACEWVKLYGVSSGLEGCLLCTEWSPALRQEWKAVSVPSVIADTQSANVLLSVEALPITLPASHLTRLLRGQSNPPPPFLRFSDPPPCPLHLLKTGREPHRCVCVHPLGPPLQPGFFARILQQEQQTYACERKQCSLASPERVLVPTDCCCVLTKDKGESVHIAATSIGPALPYPLTPTRLSCDCALNIVLLVLRGPVCLVLTQPGHGVPLVFFFLFLVHVLQWNFECLHVILCRPTLPYPLPFPC